MEVWLPSALSVIVVGISAGAAVFVATRQIRASTVTTVRMKWIESLREALAQLQAGAAMLYGGMSIGSSREATDSMLFDWFLAQHRVRLLLHQSDPMHKHFLSVIEELRGTPPGGDTKQHKAWSEKVTRSAQDIIQAERDRIERLK